ncbi:ROK family protein [Streptomyces sp. NPDC047072]|uniref:ROK family protein n=1 Tax=Streptomyces sp. NPDC047072 TaxID=3154809 RepID=UPI0033E8F0C2
MTGDGYVVGVDVGGTSIKCALFTPSCRPLYEHRRPTPRGADEAVAEVLDAVRLLTAEGERRYGTGPLAVGVAVLGLVDEATGVAVRSAATGWRDVPLAALLRGVTPAPVAVGQDLRAGALAEARLGAGRNLPGFLFAAIGTGVGGAVVLDGTPLTGSFGRAGEIGHLPARGADGPCGCGGRGCVETVAAARALSARYSALTGRTTDAAHVAEAVRAGDPAATGVWDTAVEALASAFGTAALLLDPAAVVIGGGVAAAGDLLLTPLRAALARHVPFGPLPPLLPAELGDRAALYGAALLAAEAHALTHPVPNSRSVQPC